MRVVRMNRFTIIWGVRLSCATFDKALINVSWASRSLLSKPEQRRCVCPGRPEMATTHTH
eukprot:6109781-Amphidinium_carterae.1